MLAIFKRDFRSFFTSPLGYVFCAVFIFLAYLVFFFFNVMSQYSDITGLFSFLVQTLMFLLPLLTMKLLSDETRHKTDQLLLTSPVSVTDIVMGKFFAAMGVIGVATVGTFAIPLIISLYGTPANWQIFANYFMLILAIGTYVAVGLFISSLTESQLIAAILSYIIFFGIYILPSFADLVQIPIFQTIIHWLSIFSRFANITSGILQLSDIVYFISVIAIFLFLTTRVLEKKRWA